MSEILKNTNQYPKWYIVKGSLFYNHSNNALLRHYWLYKRYDKICIILQNVKDEMESDYVCKL